MLGRALFVSILGALVTLASGAGAASWEDKLKKIYPAAKAEGKVIFNSRRISEVGGKKGVAQFKKRFPGIDIVFTGISGSKLPARITLEAKAGRISIDAFRADPDRARQLAEKGLLLQVDPASLTDFPVKTFFDNRFFKVSDHITNFAYNTSLLKAADRPKTYEDLLKPEFKRKLILDARGGQISHLASEKIWDKGKFWKFVKDLKAQKPVWTARNSTAMAKLTSGEGLISTGSYVAIQTLKRKGAPVEFLFLSPSLSQVRAIGIIKGAPHPNAAKLLLGWLLSPEGLKARDRFAVSTITPGTNLYKRVKASGANIIIEDSIEKIKARGAVGDKVTAEWGVLKGLKKKRKKKKKKKKSS
jgi:iron(III) transport system substrate-binding protein